MAATAKATARVESRQAGSKSEEDGDRCDGVLRNGCPRREPSARPGQQQWMPTRLVFGAADQVPGQEQERRRPRVAEQGPRVKEKGGSKNCGKHDQRGHRGIAGSNLQPPPETPDRNEADRGDGEKAQEVEDRIGRSGRRRREKKTQEPVDRIGRKSEPGGFVGVIVAPGRGNVLVLAHRRDGPIDRESLPFGHRDDRPENGRVHSCSSPAETDP